MTSDEIVAAAEALFARLDSIDTEIVMNTPNRQAGLFLIGALTLVLIVSICANLVPYVGAQLPFGAGLRVFDQATGGPPQCGSEDEEQRGKSSKGDSRVSEPPIKRRLLVMLVCLMGSVGFALRAGDALYKERRALSAYWFAAALLCGLAGYGALLLNAYPATWGWWL